MNRWTKELKDSVTSVDELLALVGLKPSDLPGGVPEAADYPLLAPRPYLRRIRPGDPNDPLLRQILPDPREAIRVPGFSDDPLSEERYTRAPGILQKYAGRLLASLSPACAVHCRFCFRRVLKKRPDHGVATVESIVSAVAADPSITEVILSGGDPLVLGDAALAELISRLGEIGHLARLRIHTRLPIVLPGRVTGRLARILGESRLRTVVSVHANHPAEIDDAVASALGRLARFGAILLNQSVLLRGVNDDSAVLCRLSERLGEIGVLPYYLHRLDRVTGSAHFAVPDEEAAALHQAMRSALPGYLVPRWVREEPGASSKIPFACGD